MGEAHFGRPHSEENCFDEGGRACCLRIDAASRDYWQLDDAAVPSKFEDPRRPTKFQTFINNYRDTYRRKYRSPTENRDTFRVTYEQLDEGGTFEQKILPLLWSFLGVDSSVQMKILIETKKQADPVEDLAEVIDNYEELEFCFRHTDVLHFANKKRLPAASTKYGSDIELSPPTKLSTNPTGPKKTLPYRTASDCSLDEIAKPHSWSILLPICSRTKPSQDTTLARNGGEDSGFNTNRLIDVAIAAQYSPDNETDGVDSWNSLEAFASSLRESSDECQLSSTECVVGIDVDDPVFRAPRAQQRITDLLPCKVQFIDIEKPLYGRVCKIWNHLARSARNDFLVLLGDDVILLDSGWQRRVADRFSHIKKTTGLPFGAACVALRDVSFPGFPTFPVVHRWHVQKFRSLLPKQFINQGGDPFLYELYSRFGAAEFEMSCRLVNTIGGDGAARYKKHEINWRGQILRLQLLHLEEHTARSSEECICLDVIVPSFRVNNRENLRRIGLLRASIPVNVRFWFIADNPLESHVAEVRYLADELNEKQASIDGNYFIHVIDYGEHRGASYARNIGYNYSTADWALFLDDDVLPEDTILDAYVGAIKRHPNAKVFVGLTELPASVNLWTEMLRTCNIMYFYGVARHRTHPAWGVTANLMVRGSRHNSTVQFKLDYPKTGGGEDIDFVFQLKRWYPGRGVVVGVPGARARHPWWNNAGTCYNQITGWAWGDSLCITEWPKKTFTVFPNWVEFFFFVLFPAVCWRGTHVSGLLAAGAIACTEHLLLGVHYFSNARILPGGFIRHILVSAGSGSIVTAQEWTRVCSLLWRCSFFSVCRRFDWNDGLEPQSVLDTQLRSIIRFILFVVISWSFGALCFPNQLKDECDFGEWH